MGLINCHEYISKFSISPFVLQQGQVMLLSISIGSDVRFCAQNREHSIVIKKQPYWINFTIDKMNNNIIDKINQNMEYLLPYFSSKLIHNERLLEQNIQILSGWDIRLVNMFIYRTIYGMDFFELNLAGLSRQSILLALKFALAESHHNATYLIIDPNSKFLNNPVFIDENNIESIYNDRYD